MNQRASQNCASGNASPAWGDWEYAPDRIQSVRAQIVVGRQVEKLPIEAKYHAVGRFTQPPRARRDRLEGRLDVRRRATDHLKDLARRRLLLQRLRLALQRLCQALLELADPRTFVLPLLTGAGLLGFDLGLPRFCFPTHRPLLTSHRRFDRTEIDDRLGEGALVGKSDGRILDDACEQARFEALG